MTVEGIKNLIEHLPFEDQSALAAWISRRDSAAWANQIEADFSAGGAGMKLLAAIDAEIEAGSVEGFRVTPLRK